MMEDDDMNSSDSSLQLSPIPIYSLSLKQHPEYQRYVRESEESNTEGGRPRRSYCRRLLPLRSKLKVIQSCSREEKKRIREGSFGEPSLYHPHISSKLFVESEESVELEVRLNEYRFVPRTLFIIHPFLLYSASEAPREPIRCILPTKLSSEPQVYEISRDTENPAQVDVQLKAGFVHTEEDDEESEEEEREEEEEKEEEREVGSSEGSPVCREAASEVASVSTELPSAAMSYRPGSSQGSDTKCALQFPASLNSCASLRGNPTVQLTPFGNAVSTAPTVLHIPSQPLYPPNHTVILTGGTPTHIVSSPSLTVPTIITSTPAVIQRELVLPPIPKGVSVFPVQNASLVVATTPISALPSLAPSQMAKSAEKKNTGDGKDDLTHDGESSRPGYVTLCHNCGTKSTNFHCCDSCRRTIPRDSRILPDSLQQQFLHTTVKGSPTTTTPIRPVKRQKKVKQPEEITLSSDEEESTPEKKPKLNDDDKMNCDPAVSDKVNADGTGMYSATATEDGDENQTSQGTVMYDEEITEIRESIKKILETGTHSINYVQVKCRSFRVGSYKYVDKGLYYDKDFLATITEEGMYFRMPHLLRPRDLLEIVIPKNAILQVTAHYEKRAAFLILHVGNKIARWIRLVLGIPNKPNSDVWFDPIRGGPAEKNVAFMVEIFQPEAVGFIGRVFGPNNVKVVDAIRANEILMEMAVPERHTSDLVRPDPTAGPKSNGNGVEQGVKQKVTVVTHPIVSSKVSPSSSSSSSSSASASSSKPAAHLNIIPGIKKVNLRSQQDKQKNGKLPVGHSAEADAYIDGTRTILHGKGKKLIPLHQMDVMTLRPEQFINDQIIDFWLSYVYNYKLSVADRERTHIFSTFFYNGLTTLKSGYDGDKSLSAAEKRHRRVKKWTKNVDLFSKDFIIVPINDNCHWYVAVICFPGLKGPQWMNDGTPIENWSNLIKVNGKPKYTRPPGMPERDDDKPPRRRVKKKPQELPDGHPSTSKPVNGVSAANNADLGGNPIPPSGSGGERPEESGPEKEKVSSNVVGEPRGKKVPEKPTLPPINSKAPPKVGNIINNNCKGPEDIPLAPEDPFKDEAKDDSDEDFLINEYWFTDDESEEEEEEEDCKESLPKDVKVESEPDPVDTTVKSEPQPMDVDVKTEAVLPKAEVKEEQDSKDVRTDFRVKQPCILIFNSLPGLARTRVFATLRDYLRIEYKERKGEERAFSKFDMPGFEPTVPLQKNMCDCGVYLLEYVERFFQDPLSSYLLALPTKLRKWFPELKNKRKEIYDKICELVKEENPNNLRLVPKFDVPPPPPPAVNASGGGGDLPSIRTPTSRDKKTDISKIIKNNGDGSQSSERRPQLTGPVAEPRPGAVVGLNSVEGGSAADKGKSGVSSVPPGKKPKVVRHVPISTGLDICRDKSITSRSLDRMHSAVTQKRLTKSLVSGKLACRKNSLTITPISNAQQQVESPPDFGVSSGSNTSHLVPTSVSEGVEIPITIVKTEEPTASIAEPSESSQTAAAVESAPKVLLTSKDGIMSLTSPPQPGRLKASKVKRSSSTGSRPLANAVEIPISIQAKPKSVPVETSPIQVESAPRHRLVPATPEEEPMEIDPVTTE